MASTFDITVNKTVTPIAITVQPIIPGGGNGGGLTQDAADARYRLLSAPIPEGDIPATITRDTELATAIASITPEAIGALGTDAVGDSVMPYSSSLNTIANLPGSGALISIGAGGWYFQNLDTTYQSISPDLSTIGSLSGTGILQRVNEAAHQWEFIPIANFATAEQGALAASALQPGTAIANISGLQTALNSKALLPVVQALGDANAAIASTTAIARITATLTAARTYTLPAASAVANGWEIELADASNSAGISGRTAILAATGSDTINGLSTCVLRIPNGRIRVRSNGVNRWAIASAPDVFHSLVTTSTTYTPPETATVVKWYGLGGGGAGGGGGTGAAGTNRSGGGAGAPGGMTYGEWAIAELLALYGTKDLVVTIGAGGIPAAATSANSTNGSAGGSGGNTIISCGGVVIGVGLGANGGTGGPSTGTQSAAILNVGSAFPMPTLANGTNLSGGSGAIANGFGPSGGGGGGGLDTANTSRSGGTGGIGGRTSKNTTGGASGTAGGGNGGDGNALTANPYNWGDGGGGGGSNNAGNGGNGGAASGYGNGGGGGGACVNGNTAGAGGSGAPGCVLFIAYRG